MNSVVAAYLITLGCQRILQRSDVLVSLRQCCLKLQSTTSVCQLHQDFGREEACLGMLCSSKGRMHMKAHLLNLLTLLPDNNGATLIVMVCICRGDPCVKPTTTSIM